VAPSPLTEPLQRLAEAWRSTTRASRRRVAVALVALVWVLALLVARHGTLRSRLGAGAAIGVSVVLAVGWRLVELRRLRRPERILRGIAGGVDREGAERALRALSLVGPDGDVRGDVDGTSPELARLHVERSLAALPIERIVERAARGAARLGVAALVVGVCVAGVTIANAWSVLEGADVLVARRGRAPVAMHWLDDLDIAGRPPEYLHDTEVHEIAMSSLVLPYGTLVTLRGAQLHPGRRLLLSDGTTEVPFVDDGTDHVVARWPVTASTTLHVVARFGDVVVQEPDALPIESIPDAAPIVTLEGAPRQVLLADQTEDIPIRYTAIDDHGLREVHLVLRSGVGEDRRVLSHLDGETKVDKGGQLLRLRDRFIEKSHAPIEVVVEAKDNDPLTGPKWGASAAITLIPPDVGEPEARRLEGLRDVRNALVDSLAWRLAHDAPADAAGRRSLAVEDRKDFDLDDRILGSALETTYAGVRVPGRVRAMIAAREQRMRKAIEAEERAPSPTTHAAVVRTTEQFVLVIDAIIRGLGQRDTRASAKILADVADDLATGANQATADAPEDRSRGAVRMDAATVVLSGGGRVMKRLGELGRDIGEIVEADLARVKRARDGADWMHAELAARDLSARLREPDPSFGSRGSSARGGGESGGGRGAPGEGDEGGSSPDEVSRAFNEARGDLEQLAQDHAGEIGKIEKDLAGATSEDDLDALKEEAKRHAEAVREAAKQLPNVGQGSDSWTSKGAAARELAEQMARSLEQMHPDQASQSGKSAVGSLDEAKKMLQKGGWFDDPTGEEQKKVDDARRKLDAEQKWAEQAVKEMRQKAAERARKQLQQGGDEEGKLADRARELGQRGRDKAGLPDEAVDSIDDAERASRQAAEALKQGQADKGLEKQRDAQRSLEQALQQLDRQGDEDSSPSSSQEDASRGPPDKGNVDVPGKGGHKGPDEFRRRVVQGLAQPSGGALKDAVHRYAEGLLR
jgi:hypothetical protein